MGVKDRNNDYVFACAFCFMVHACLQSVCFFFFFF